MCIWEENFSWDRMQNERKYSKSEMKYKWMEKCQVKSHIG